jgi:hypothetical protein
MTDEPADPQFDADVQVGKVWHYIDRQGRATVEAGRLSLRKRSGEVIAQADLSDVQTDVVRGSINIWMGGERYVITPLRARRAYEGTIAAAGTNLARDLKRLKASKQLGAQFLQVVEAQGGHVGRRDK